MNAHYQKSIITGHKKRQRRAIYATIILGLILLLLCFLGLILGNTPYSLKTISLVFAGLETGNSAFAILTLRLPRMLAGLFVGLSFGMAGSTFQTLLRNPLASPDIIGVTSGASVATIFCILVLHMSGTVVSLFAVLSGFIVAYIIYALSRGGQFSGGRLILVGIGVQAMVTATISFLMLNASQYDIPAAMRWLSGSLNGIRLSQIPALGIVILVFGSLLLSLHRPLQIIELGEQSATTLGLKTDFIRLLLMICAVILIAFSTALTGPIAFVSFLSGPIASHVLGRGKGSQLQSGLVGAILVLSADIIGQFAFNIRFPVGVVTGIIGAPYLIYLLIRMNKAGGAA